MYNYAVLSSLKFIPGTISINTLVFVLLSTTVNTLFSNKS